MESTGTTVESFSNSGGTAVVATQTRQFQGIKVQNPFAFKVGQVFTGFGVGCGVGIGVGRPINMGAIPVVNQIMSATSGATHAFSGVTRYVNDALRKVGAKNIEAGIGCGVGFGHGFGIGVALKPGVINQVQSTVVQLMTKMMMKFGISPNLSIGQGTLPTSIQSSMGMMGGSLNQNPPGNMMQLSPSSQKTSQLLPGYGNMPMGSFPGLASNSSQVEPPDVTRTEMVLNKFLNDPVLKQGDAEIYNLVGSLRSENSMMQMVLKHQQVIEELKDENEKLRHILVEDLKVHPSKMQASNSPKYDKSPCADCFECRRKQRRRSNNSAAPLLGSNSATRDSSATEQQLSPLSSATEQQVSPQQQNSSSSSFSPIRFFTHCSRLEASTRTGLRTSAALKAISFCNCTGRRCSPQHLVGYSRMPGWIPPIELYNGSIYSFCFADLSTSSINKLLPLRNFSQTDLCSKLENEVKDHRVGEAWRTFKLYKKLHGYPEISVMGKLITESSYSSDPQWLQKACDLVLQHSKPKSVFLRLEIVAKLALSLARTQMPIPASKILRLMLEKGCLPPMNILRLIILHMVKSDVGTYITSNLLIEICDSNKTMPDTMIFNLILDACLRFKSFLKAQDLIELMALSGIVADSNSLALIAQIHERNGQRYELVKFKDHVDCVSAPFVHQYKQFYDSLLSLHFKFDDIDAAAELVADIYKTCDVKDNPKPHFVPIGSPHLKTGLKIIVSTKKGDDFCSFSIQNKEEFIVLRKDKLHLSKLALAKIVHKFRKNRRIEDLSKILHSTEEHTRLLDLIKGCIVVGWLETAHDLLDDFESFGCPIDSAAYFALLEAYNKRGMTKEAKTLQKQIEKRGTIMSNSSSISANSDIAELLKQEIEKTPTPPILYEVNSSIYFFSKAKMMEDAWKTYRRMQELHIHPNEQTFAALVSGFSSLQMYRDVTILWGDIKRIGKLEISRDLYELLVVIFIRGGYFERVLEVIKLMEEKKIYADKLMYKWEYRKLHRNLYRSLRASEASSEAQRKRLEFVVEFRRWLGSH